MRAIVTLFLAVVSAGVAAEKEDKIVPITQPRDDTAISATKREFDTIKSSRDPAMQQKGDVPRLIVPELPASGIGVGWTPPKTNTQEKKSANWLVDAMENRAAEDKSRTRDKLDPDRERRGINRAGDDPLAGEKSASEELQQERGPDGAREGDRKAPANATVNPLAHYLGEWMTPQDYSLLKPGLAQSSANAFGREVGIGTALPIPGATMPGADGQAGLTPNLVPPIAAVGAKPKENPFLQALNAPAMPANPSTSFGPPAIATTTVPPKAPILTTPPPPVVEPAKSKIPEFVKPAEDEKYFKQLKRF